MRARSSLLLSSAMILAGCLPDPGDPASLLAGPRVLAVRADPPETRPGAAVTYEALVIDADGARAKTAVRWAFCASPKPLTETTSVSSACLDDAGVRPIAGSSASITAKTPDDACALFGPDTPPGDFRPRDADVTGGFYQPVRIEALGLVAFARERVTCNLPNAPVDAAIELRSATTPTRTPRSRRSWRAWTARSSRSRRSPRARACASESAGTRATPRRTRCSIPARRGSPRAAGAARGVVRHGGPARRGGDRALESELEASTENTWEAPATPGATKLWLVLRDSRGGVDFAGYEVVVER